MSCLHSILVCKIWIRTLKKAKCIIHNHGARKVSLCKKLRMLLCKSQLGKELKQVLGCW